MSKRLQVLVDEQELEEIRAVARRQHLTVAQWVRQALRKARDDQPASSTAAKLSAIHAASEHGFPAPDIGQMLVEIERGYRGGDGR